jgi:hypothetical protein
MPSRLVVLVVCLTVAAGPVPVIGAAAAGVSRPAIASLRAEILPEHDDPRLLVIYRGTLEASAPLPFTLSFAIPAGAQVHAAAYRRNEALLSAPYQVAAGAERSQVVFSVPERTFQFEYYADVITGRPERAFSIDLLFPTSVGALEVAVEQPRRASGFRLSPAAGSTTAAGGFTYHLYPAQPWPAGRVWRVRGSYQKADSEPSLPRPGPPAGSPAAGPPARSAATPWLAALGGFLLGAAVVGAIWFLRRERRAGQRAGSGRRLSRGGEGDREGDRTRHCPNCGARVRPQDRFCQRCGHALRGG